MLALGYIDIIYPEPKYITVRSSGKGLNAYAMYILGWHPNEIFDV